MIVTEIKGYGFLNHDRKAGTTEDIDSVVYLIIKGGGFVDGDGFVYHIHHNLNEGTNVVSYDDGIDHYCPTIEDLVETLKLLIEGSL